MTELADYTFFPIRNQELYDKYQQAVACFWRATEVDLSGDLSDMNKLTPGERKFILKVLAFFAGSDGIVIENLALRFLQEAETKEDKAFYAVQIAMETIHSEMYSMLIEVYSRNEEEKTELFRALEVIPSIRSKGKWAIKWIDQSSYEERLVAFAVVEGVFFSGAFCSIFWFKKRGLLPGLAHSNELISRDEGLHTDFACLVYNMLSPERKLGQDRVYEIFREAVNCEHSFIDDILPEALPGMNSDSMKVYIEFVADRLLKALGYQPLYRAENPFDWMEMISLPGKTNFFERRISEYKGYVANDINQKIDTSIDF